MCIRDRHRDTGPPAQRVKVVRVQLRRQPATVGDRNEAFEHRALGAGHARLRDERRHIPRDPLRVQVGENTGFQIEIDGALAHGRGFSHRDNQGTS